MEEEHQETGQSVSEVKVKKVSQYQKLQNQVQIQILWKIRQLIFIDVEANTLEDIATVVIDANTLEETVLFLESETQIDLGGELSIT